MIEPCIHQIWIGDKTKPDWCDAWESLEGWDYVLWDEDALSQLGMKHQALYDQYIADGCLNGAANIARVEILAQHGGVYIDADTEHVSDFADEPFMRSDVWVVHSPNVEPAEDGTPTRLVNGIMAATKGHAFIASYQRALGKVTDLHPSWRKTGAELMTAVFNRKKKNDIPVLPAHTFLPFTMRNKRIGPNTFGIHRYGTTKKLYK